MDKKEFLKLMNMSKEEIDNLPRHCFRCNIKMKKKLTELQAELNGHNMTLEGIECWKCPNCGEKVFSSETVGKIEEWFDIDGFKPIEFND
ncbi:MAG: YgiT-type zinc finger protein [bacterium]